MLFASSLQFSRSFESNSRAFSLYMENKMLDPSMTLVCVCGACDGLRFWVPVPDHSKVIREWRDDDSEDTHLLKQAY